MSEFTPTEEQAAIIEHIRGTKASAVVSALAGTAKTTTLEMAAPSVEGSALALAFNTRIKDELERRLPSTFQVRTLNSIGHSAWGRGVSKKLELDQKKEARLSRKVPAVKGMLSAARVLGLVPSRRAVSRRFIKDDVEGWEAVANFAGLVQPSEELIGLARSALEASIKEAYEGIIDFTDQIYMPACFGGGFTRFDTIFLDEAQDFSKLNLHLLKSLAGGRVIGVGDKRQSLYSWRGAAASAMDDLGEMMKFLRQPPIPGVDLRLTTCFRCSEAVVVHAQELVPELQPREGAPKGLVHYHKGRWGLCQILSGSAILCRNNAPLVKLFFAFLRAGIPVHFQGRDVGERARRLVQSLGLKTSSIEALHEALESKAAVVDKEWIRELTEVVKSIPGETVEEVLKGLDELLKPREGTITLSTGHGAKGLEWPRVYHLDSWRIPSVYAETEEEIEAERNIDYVIRTRAQHTLCYIDAKNFVE